ncbi:MAG: ABC transporter substrate-binding protein [Kiloniellaceae bacterium]
MTTLRRLARAAALGVSAAILVLGLAGGAAEAQQKTLKIGVLGVMSGPAASWGLVNRYCAEAAAQMINEQGGWKIGGEKYKIEIIAIDDRNDPKVSVAGAERLVYQEGVKYIIGPNVDTTAAAIVPVIEKAGAINIPYAFSKRLYSPPRSNSILGMIASYQAGPVIYKYLMENKGVKSVSFIARNASDPLNQRDEGVDAAKRLGLKILSSEDTYEPGTTDFFPVMSRVVRQNPDLIVLSGVAPSDAPLLIRAARELGYQGLLSTETAQDAKILSEVAGDLANGFISVGGASTPAIRSKTMEAFVDRYVKVAGEWNDEAGTKVYALEMILNTLKDAGPKALEDVAEFKKAIPAFQMRNPFLKEEKTLKYVGSAYFGQPRQIGVPMVVNVFKDGDFETLFVGSVEG